MTLTQFQRVASFLKAQGIALELDMLSLEPGAWSNLLNLTSEWEEEIESHKQLEPTKEELEMERLQEANNNLYHSSR